MLQKSISALLIVPNRDQQTNKRQRRTSIRQHRAAHQQDYLVYSREYSTLINSRIALPCSTYLYKWFLYMVLVNEITQEQCMNRRNVEWEIKAIVKADKGPLRKQVKASGISDRHRMVSSRIASNTVWSMVNACVGDYHLPYRVWSNESTLYVLKALNGHYINSGWLTTRFPRYLSI